MISPVTSASSTATSSTAASTATTSKQTTVNYNQFLQLLIAEMRNQDPTNPMDPTQTVSQLATFSGVEQQVQTNTTLDNMMVGLKLPNPSKALPAYTASTPSSTDTTSSTTGA